MAWDARLVEAGVEITATDARHVRLQHGTRDVVLRLVRTSRQLHPSDVTSPPQRSSLLVAPAASQAAAERARSKGWSLVTDEGPAWIRFPGEQVLELPQHEEPPPAPRARPGRPPWGTMTVVRRLLLTAPAPQTRLAALAEVTQARVSQVFERLRAEELILRTRDGWVPSDWDALCDWWLRHYPGPGGTTTWWTSLATPAEQAATAVSSLATSATPVVSGDAAADLVAPWRRPALAIVYAQRGTNLGDANLTLLPTHEGATLKLAVPEDTGVWPDQPTTQRWKNTTIGLADGLQILYDLQHSPGPDADEAAAQWRNHLRNTITTTETP